MPTPSTVYSDANHRDAIERELRWLLDARPIWTANDNHDCVPLSKICNGSLPEIAENLAAEWAWHGAPKRLGRRFESLLTALFEQSDQCKLLKHGLVIRDQKQTVGEIDYVIELPSGVLHLEVAIKFYAGVGNPSDREHTSGWIGPSCQDRLDLKINHLLTHQLRLSQTPLAQQTFAEAELPLPKRVQGLIYGYLIQPWASHGTQPEGLHMTDIAYWTCYSDAHEAMRALSRPYSTEYGWTRLERDQWIAPYAGPSELPLVIKTLERPIQADCYALTTRRGGQKEKFRIFVMHDQYEQDAFASMRQSH